MQNLAFFKICGSENTEFLLNYKNKKLPYIVSYHQQTKAGKPVSDIRTFCLYLIVAKCLSEECLVEILYYVMYFLETWRFLTKRSV